MKIKTDSWHYSWYSFFLEQTGLEIKQPNLCKYFWVVVIGAPMIVIALFGGKLLDLMGRAFKRIPTVTVPNSVVSATGWLAVVLAIGLVLFMTTIVGIVIYQNPLTTLIVMGIILGVLLGAAIAIVLIMWFLTAAEERDSKPKEIREPRKPLEIPGTIKLVWAFIWAKKEHVCPFITFDTVEERN